MHGIAIHKSSSVRNNHHHPVSSPGILANKPNYEIGSAMKLNFGKPAVKAETAKVWKLDDDDEEEINEDDLLDEEDKKKPEEASLRVCGTTGKRKACKDCSCGLAEELNAEKSGQAPVDTANAKSSCGSVSVTFGYVCMSVHNPCIVFPVLPWRCIPMLYVSLPGHARFQARRENRFIRRTNEGGRMSVCACVYMGMS